MPISIDKKSKIIALCIFICSSWLSFTSIAIAADWTIEPGVEITQRDAEFVWSIAGNRFGTNPNIVSELTWRDLEIQELTASVRASWKNDLYLRAHIMDGDITDGTNQDSDYAYDDREGEFSRSVNSANTGSTVGRSIAIGIPIRQTIKSSVRPLTLVPLFGFSYHEQNLRMRNGVQTVSDTQLAIDEGFIDPDSDRVVPPVGYRLLGLNATYETEWEDVWFGFDLLIPLGTSSRLTASVEYHDADYYAAANWNLRQNLQHPLSFAHWADGDGVVFKLDWSAYLSKSLLVGVNLDLQRWETDVGRSLTYAIITEATEGFNIGDHVTIPTQFNGAEWESYSWGLYMAYQFTGP